LLPYAHTQQFRNKHAIDAETGNRDFASLTGSADVCDKNAIERSRHRVEILEDWNADELLLCRARLNQTDYADRLLHCAQRGDLGKIRSSDERHIADATRLGGAEQRGTVGFGLPEEPK